MRPGVRSPSAPPRENPRDLRKGPGSCSSSCQTTAILEGGVRVIHHGGCPLIISGEKVAVGLEGREVLRFSAPTRVSRSLDRQPIALLRAGLASLTSNRPKSASGLKVNWWPRQARFSPAVCLIGRNMSPHVECVADPCQVVQICYAHANGQDPASRSTKRRLRNT